jgi:succinate-semialdehyde dehydrogenase/glutarate-semialdehyde dehydrogenase
MKIIISDKDLYKTGAFINGDWVNSDDRSTYSVNNPATGEIIAEVANCGFDETTRAINAANYP